MVNSGTAPTVQVWRSEDDTHWTVQIDTAADAGPVAVDLNDGRIFSGDPETFDAVVASENALEQSGEDVELGRGVLQLLVEAVRGETREPQV